MLNAAEPVDQVLRLLLRCLPFVEDQSSELCNLLATKGLPEALKAVVPWAPLYEMTFVRHVLCVVQAIGASDELRALAQSPTPNLAVLHAVEREVTSNVEVQLSGEPDLALVLSGVLSMSSNMRALGTHGVPINKLLVIGTAGNDSALLKAVRIDPTVLSGKTLSIRLARAMAERDSRFFKDAIVAIRDGGLKAPGSVSGKERHPRLKFCLSILEDLGQLDALSESAAYELFAVRLGVYPQEGQVKDAARSLWRLIDRWKRFVRAT